MTLQKISANDKNINNRLSVQFSLTGLSFLVTNSISNEVVFNLEINNRQLATPEELLLLLQTTLEDTIELHGKFVEINLLYATNLYSLVPSSLFDKTKASEYLKFNSKILANDFIAYDTLDNYGITIVYIPFVNINNYIFDRFGDFNYYHASTILLRYLLNKEKHSLSPKVFVNIVDDTFIFIAIRNGKLEHCNTYEFKTPEDFIYYILFSLEQLKLNPDTIDLKLSGTVSKENAIYKIAYTYIRNISFINFQELKINDKENHTDLLLKLIL